ncbi:MAG: hypothetical protein K2H43_05470 [Clostridia bacterium]|nr:hypothetical protein [Clostridia bacterium]
MKSIKIMLFGISLLLLAVICAAIEIHGSDFIFTTIGIIGGSFGGMATCLIGLFMKDDKISKDSTEKDSTNQSKNNEKQK